MTKNENTYTVGIIAEYNPFHNGHAYQIQKAKELTGADRCIVVMSGDFVQRGAPAIYDKYTRTAMALSCGADLVLEIPSLFAVSSAEDFAACAVALLSRLKAVDFLCFGSEVGEVKKLSDIATILAEEPPVYSECLKEELKKGQPFPAARIKALVSSKVMGGEEALILQSPNNILGIEYLKALHRQKSPIKPCTVLRQGKGYHDNALSSEGFGSATGIRKAINDAPLQMESMVFCHVPEAVKPLMEQGHPIFPDDLSILLNAALLRLDREGIPFEAFSDVSPELAARMKKQLPDFLPFEEKISALKTRQYTYTRVSRALLHILLDMTDEKVQRARAAGYAPYARVLGFKKEASDLLGDIKRRGEIPLLTKTASARTMLTGTASDLFMQDLYSSHIYQTLVQGKYRVSLKNEFTHSVILR